VGVTCHDFCCSVRAGGLIKQTRTKQNKNKQANKQTNKQKNNHKTTGIHDLVFVKLMHQSDSRVMSAILSEFSKCSSEIFYLILLFLCFILENCCSQMYILPEAVTQIRLGCEVRGISFW